ncbi:major facilitator superfamily domain-containing protein [Mycena albidolilacea]|uniref:Major facilitator superfamily domain-containing protein n=1 Tax=Mycena albidolilacea TaxID=1033008 RepID=A0AAD7F5V0_9AGAR|nr:major facilitator superfamily domain-containing protein [Mycena albidolilacea]
MGHIHNLTHSIATMSTMSIQDSQESVDALPKSNDMELAHRIPLPASTSTFFRSSDTLSHLDSTDNPVSSSNSRNILRNMNESALPPVDKGLRAWSFLAAAFMIEAIVWGFPNAYGIFLDAYLQDPRYASQKNAASLLPLIGTLSSGIIYCSGLFINPIATRYPQHRRKSMWVGAVLSCGALFGASYATEIFQLVLLQGVLYAVGGSLLYQPCISYMSEWFVARRGMANGILFAGTAAGGLLLPLALPRLMSKYGPSKTLRILAIGTTILLFPLLPFLKGRLPQTRVRIQGPVPRGASGTRNWMKDKLFWIFLAVNTLQGFGYFIPIIYLPTFANDLHISSSNSAVTLAMLNGASVVGRLSMGYLSDSLNPWILALTTLFTTSVATFILWGVFSHSFAGLLAFGIAYGSIAGGWSSLWTGFVRPIANDDPAMSTTIYGYLLLTRGVGNIMSAPISAALYSQSHNITGSPERTGFDVGDGRFEKMIIYVGTCFAGAAGVAALGLTMDARKGRQTGNQNSE